MAAGASIERSPRRHAPRPNDRSKARTSISRRRRPMSTSSQIRPRQLAGLAAVLAFAVTAGGAASPSAAGSPQSGGSINIAIVGDPGTIHPMKDGGIADNYVSELIRDRLVCSGQDGGIVPCL